jgi:hypothetical protein
MITTAPKNSRHKRLHIVFFTDASKTKSTSVSLRNLGIVSVVIFSFFAAAGASIYLYKQNKKHLFAKDQYVKELKAAITSIAVTGEKDQWSMASEDDPNTALSRKVAREIQFPTVADQELAEERHDKTLENLQTSLSNLSTVSANLARNQGADSKKSNSFAAKSSEDKSSPSSASSSNPAVGEPSSAGGTASESTTSHSIKSVSTVDEQTQLQGVRIEQSHSSEMNGQTTIHFQLVNASRNRAQIWSGWVCGIAEVSGNGSKNVANNLNVNTQPLQSSAHKGFIAFPSGSKVSSPNLPNNRCNDGEFVRFARLRPTELVIPAKQDDIKRVTLFFVDSASNKVLSQQIDL